MNKYGTISYQRHVFAGVILGLAVVQAIFEKTYSQRFVQVQLVKVQVVTVGDRRGCYVAY